ncbi:MAG TPA: hypothetical protein VFB59_01470 [Candidatus Saccharimonadales bacterium]|nr:hypothetical protein [Candidatus Saccharimonadales bacterium]
MHFDRLTARLLERRRHRIDIGAFRPLITTVVFNPATSRALFVAPNAPDSKAKDWFFPTLELEEEDKVTTTLNYLIAQQLGVDLNIVSSVTEIRTDEFATVGGQSPDNRMDLYLPFLCTVTDESTVTFDPAVGKRSKWHPIHQVHTISKAHSSVPERNTVQVITDQVLRSV